MWVGFALVWCASGAETPPSGGGPPPAEDLFTRGVVPRLRIEIPAEGMEVLRSYRQMRGQPRPERVDVRATVREGERTYTNVAIHLKGSFTFEPVDAKPSLTLKFGKFAPGQQFHGLSKIHLNNSVQDPSYLCERLARELFNAVGVPSARAGQALVELNGRRLGCYVLVEGWDTSLLARHFQSTRGNLYEGDLGNDVTKPLKVDVGENPDDGSDLTNLVQAAQEPDPTRRLARLEQVLDLDRFLSFVAVELLLVHWDGYAMGPNNYRVFHDAARDRMVFMPHGLDQLFGVGRSPRQTLTPHWGGLVARAVITTPEGRRRYLERIANLFTNHFRLEPLIARADEMAGQLRAALKSDPELLAEFEAAVLNLKSRMSARVVSAADQLAHPEQPLAFGPDRIARPAGWQFKTGFDRPARARRLRENGREILQVAGSGAWSTGSWRALVLLEEGRYELIGRARTEGVTSVKTNGVILRVSGERSPKGLVVASEWTDLRYEFEVRGIANEELVCEFRGAQGSGWFDPASIRLIRKEPVSAPDLGPANSGTPRPPREARPR